MKYTIVAIAFVFAALTQTFGQQAGDQTKTQQQKVTDEELKKYAVTMDSINDMKTSLSEEISEILKADGKMTVERYTELSKIAEDSTQLAAANATPEEIALLKTIADKKNEGIAEINNTYQALARDYVGAASFNKVKKALSTDPALKAKYEAMLEELGKG